MLTDIYYYVTSSLDNLKINEEPSIQSNNNDNNINIIEYTEEDILTNRLKPEEIDIIIYHKNCTDGYMSYTIFNNYMKNKNIKFLSLESFSDTKFIIEQFKDKNILFCDVILNLDLFLPIYNICNKILLIDHHIGNKIDYIDSKILKPYEYIYDINHCASYLLWRYLYPINNNQLLLNNDEYYDIPESLKYVEDNDLLNEKYIDTKYFNCYIKSIDRDYKTYLKLLNNTKYCIQIIKEGKKLYIDELNKLKSLLSSNTIFNLIEINKQYYFISQTFTIKLKSEVCNYIIKKYNFLNYSLGYSYFKEDNTRINSYRSGKLNYNANVQLITSKFNGSGHRNAAAHKGEITKHCQIVFTLDNQYDLISILNLIELNSLHINNEEINILTCFNITNNNLSSIDGHSKFGTYLLQPHYINNNNIFIQEYDIWFSNKLLLSNKKNTSIPTPTKKKKKKNNNNNIDNDDENNEQFYQIFNNRNTLNNFISIAIFTSKLNFIYNDTYLITIVFYDYNVNNMNIGNNIDNIDDIDENHLYNTGNYSFFNNNI